MSNPGLKESYSLWFMPKGALATRLHREIHHLAAKPRLSDAPDFFPHVTLLGGIDAPKAEVLATAEQLVTRLRPFTISFDRVASGTFFYQCVYILCKETPELMAAGREAKAAYGMDPDSTYMPHLSLVYSDIDPAGRQALAEEELQRLLGPEGGADALAEREFEVDCVAVWYTPPDKSLESWRAVSVLPLSKN